MPPDVLVDYHAFLQGRDPLKISDYSGPHSRRDVMECVLFQQALARGGFPHSVVMTDIASYGRTILELTSGDIVALGTSAWLSDLENRYHDILISPPLIRRGEFEAGLYTAPENEMALQADSLEKVTALSAVCSRQWQPDWRILEGMGISQLLGASTWEVMVHMVGERRADFLLAPFQPTEGMRLETMNTLLVPIPGLKVHFPGSRHFGVSRFHPQGRELFEALVRGLQHMRSDGTIARAYTECGFIHPATEGWTVLNNGKADAGRK
ncbi:hypothetical protein [Pseudodesulfovibrio sp.]|uniref:hypothetical protein n=1 Tax=unclassified Pseudodesulfovibrio TaxID=2661612 RepID=UPI003AFF663C